jgi:hypothetical protein
MNAISLNNLWSYIQGLSLTANNRRWLADRLIETPSDTVMEDNEIRKDMKEAFSKIDGINKGTVETRDVEELLNEL